jgi:hypothetical protein
MPVNPRGEPAGVSPGAVGHEIGYWISSGAGKQTRRSLRIPSQSQDDIGGDARGASADRWASIGTVSARLVEGFHLCRIV